MHPSRRNNRLLILFILLTVFLLVAVDACPVHCYRSELLVPSLHIDKYTKLKQNNSTRYFCYVVLEEKLKQNYLTEAHRQSTCMKLVVCFKILNRPFVNAGNTSYAHCDLHFKFVGIALL